MAQLYREMHDGGNFKAPDRCRASHPGDYHQTWTESLADDEYDMIPEAGTAARRRSYSTFDPDCMGHGGGFRTSYAASLPNGHDSSCSHGRPLVEDGNCRARNRTDGYGDYENCETSGQRGAQPPAYEAIFSDQDGVYDGERRLDGSGCVYSGCPPKYQKWSEPRIGLDRLSDRDSAMFADREQVNQNGRPCPGKGHPWDEKYDDNLEPKSRDQGASSQPATTGCRYSARSHQPPNDHSSTTTDQSNTRQGPPSRSQPADMPKPLSYGRYNAGVRAPQSSTNHGQARPSAGRYNMGVRVPRSGDSPSLKEDLGVQIDSEPVDSRPEEGLGSGEGRPGRPGCPAYSMGGDWR